MTNRPFARRTEDVAPTAAALSPELTQLLQSMAHELATLGQGIEQIKASQEQMVRVTAEASEQKPAAQDTSASATADHHFDAQVNFAVPVAASHNAAAG
jgi:hypothetical protein